jgi:predicted Rossmann-fold nucleotide-binding protein
MYVGRVGIKGVVAVVGGDGESALAGAKELGARLAALQSAHLLTGGGEGVAKAVSEGFYGVHPRSGVILAVVPGAKGDAHTANDYVEIPILTPFTSDPAAADSTAHVVVKTADVIVALPGAEDTLAILDLATKAKYKYGKPAVIFLPEATDAVGGKEAAALKRGKYNVATDADDVMAFVENALSETGR